MDSFAGSNSCLGCCLRSLSRRFRSNEPHSKFQSSPWLQLSLASSPYLQLICSRFLAHGRLMVCFATALLLTCLAISHICTSHTLKSPSRCLFDFKSIWTCTHTEIKPRPQWTTMSSLSRRTYNNKLSTVCAAQSSPSCLPILLPFSF